MKRTRFSDEKIIGILQEHEAGVKCADPCHKLGVSCEGWQRELKGVEHPE